ncbi:MAG: phosphoesterase [Clostridium sp.]|uniref:DHH family phosphoesterase n=1 Tax=Clostridium sp. TaxID=1506 RepID=UPI002A8A048E|nr:phosphoesterase [Clostridium sp.]MDY5097999.1 phosphoesterase [Clostridium sp.]
MQKIWDNICRPNTVLGYNPFLIDKMDGAMNRIAKAVNEREKIIVYGSSSVDSICGCALLIILLKYLNADVDYFISEKKNKTFICTEDVNSHIKILGTSLIVSIGPNIESKFQESAFSDMGIDVVEIIDYEELRDLKSISLSSNKLSLSSLTFKFTQAIGVYYNIKNVNRYIDLVMLGIASSNKKLSGENQIFYKEGLKYLPKSNNKGLRALMKLHNVCEGREEQLEKIINALTPSGNAVGESDNARIVLELLVTSNEYRAAQISKYLYNEFGNELS